MAGHKLQFSYGDLLFFGALIILSLTCHEIDYSCDYFDHNMYYENGYHFIKGVWTLGGEEGRDEYKFRNMPRLHFLVTHFPADSILTELSNSPGQDIEVIYWIFACVRDAELFMVERLDTVVGWETNMIDDPLPGGLIGDNGFYQMESRQILFIRNNVWITVRPRRQDLPVSWEEIESIARLIDTAILDAPKVLNGCKVPSPIIHSIELTQPYPSDWDQMVGVKIIATDAMHDSLTYRIVGRGYALTFTDGIDTFMLVGNYVPAFWSEDPNKYRIMVWVWNKGHFISMAEEEFAFR